MQGRFNKQLIPAGKLKGELEGEFEAMYVARDVDGKLYLNRNPEYTPDRYNPSKGWEAITQAQLDNYKKELHFIPHKRKRLKP
ncbi:MAG: hypothetical protein KF763_15445 [Cyclobacteriaceae bacterium]|nr:hypothetical protein [Cyclobacteriaceae bacterium]